MIRRLNLVLFAIGILGLGWMIHAVGVDQAWHALRSLGWGLLGLVALEGAGNFCHTMSWRCALDAMGCRVPLGRLFAIRLAGHAINYFTPTVAIGGEVVRAALIAEPERGPEAAGTVLIDKVCMALIHLLAVVVGGALLINRIHLPMPLKLTMLAVGSLLSVGVVSFLVLQKQGRFGGIVVWLGSRCLSPARAEKLATTIAAVNQALLMFYRDRRRDFLLVLGWHILGFAMGLAQAWLFFRLAHLNRSVIAVADVWIIGLWFDLLVFIVPMSLGTLEGSRILAFAAAGYPVIAGLTYGVALRVGQWFWAVAGLICYAHFTLRTPQSGRTEVSFADDRP